MEVSMGFMYLEKVIHILRSALIMTMRFPSGVNIINTDHTGIGAPFVIIQLQHCDSKKVDLFQYSHGMKKALILGLKRIWSR